ncbi:hypothetical protein HHK36_030334 [Tetracentron sinense]|uniref:Uncharacterized protein n=1 Tax=Tetracentron sinense TaxID=13715 RepID=A0A835D1G4_TETSI|nr:hypothetical protein HHK36_030334 [Tetracentron sinense]
MQLRCAGGAAEMPEVVGDAGGGRRRRRWLEVGARGWSTEKERRAREDDETESSWNMEDSPLSPTTALQFSGIPFSWEQQPGVPKKHTLSHSSSQKKKDPSLVLLPLPPAATPIASKGFNYEEMFPIRKKNSNERSKRDPFIGALVKCSKDDYWKTTKVSRLLSDRFAFIDLNVSCKRSCAVSESTIFIPRSTRTTYDLLNRRSG